MRAFLDFPRPAAPAGCAFWQAVTGYSLSPWRGEHGEFATLVPPSGDDYLRVQLIDDEAPRIHLDLAVEDVDGFAERARSLGATDAEGVVTVLRSPGGLLFCVVPDVAHSTPAPAAWPGGRSRVDQVCLDIPPSRYDDELAFWAELTGWARTDDHEDEFERLTGAGALRVLVQRRDDEAAAVTAHLDVASDDADAELARHVALGATYQHTGRGWITLADPTGLAYCVTRRTPS